MIIIIIGIVLILVLFFYVAQSTLKERKRAYIEMLNKKTTVFLALAGSEDNVSIPLKKDIQAIETNVFKNKKGEYLDPADYEHFLVHGSSMKFCGIHDNDLIFVDTNINMKIYKDFPCVLLLRRNHAIGECPKYKIRRTWMKATYTSKDALVKEIKNLMTTLPFQQIRQLDVYDGDDNMIADLLSCRIPNYENTYITCSGANDYDRNIIVSTTFHTKESKIRFSIHPISLIKGKVIASFMI